MSEKNITHANVKVNEQDRGKLVQLQMTISKPKHIITGYPLPPAKTQSLNMNATTNYGEDNEDVFFQLYQPHPPQLNDTNITTHNDLGVSYYPSGQYCRLSEEEFIYSVQWTATNLPYGLVLDSDTGYIHGQLTKGGVYTVYVTCTTEWGSDTACLTITVVEYKYWGSAVAPDCPATPGYSGTHTHGVSIDLPKGVQFIQSITNRSTVMYGGRNLTFQASGTSSYNYEYTYTNAAGRQYSRKSSCYKRAKINGIITGGYSKSTSHSKRYYNCHFKGRVKFATIVTNELVGPMYWYVDVDYTYDFFEVPGFKYDNNGVIQTYSA